jgi:hypothetical protein
MIPDNGSKKVNDDYCNDYRQEDSNIQDLVFHHQSYSLIAFLARFAQRELYRSRYQKKGNSKNNVCQRVYIGYEKYNLTGDIRFAVHAELKSPSVDDHIQKIDNKSDADQEGWIAEEIAVVIGDHVVDLVYAEEYDQEEVEKAEIGTEFRDLPKNQVFHAP